MLVAVLRATFLNLHQDDMIDSEMDQLNQRVQYFNWGKNVKKELPDMRTPAPCQECFSRMLRDAARRMYAAGNTYMNDLTSEELKVLNAPKRVPQAKNKSTASSAAAATSAVSSGTTTSTASSSTTSSASASRGSTPATSTTTSPTEATGPHVYEIFLEHPDAEKDTKPGSIITSKKVLRN